MTRFAFMLIVLTGLACSSPNGDSDFGECAPVDGPTCPVADQERPAVRGLGPLAPDRFEGSVLSVMEGRVQVQGPETAHWLNAPGATRDELAPYEGVDVLVDVSDPQAHTVTERDGGVVILASDGPTPMPTDGSSPATPPRLLELGGWTLTGVERRCGWAHDYYASFCPPHLYGVYDLLLTHESGETVRLAQGETLTLEGPSGTYRAFLREATQLEDDFGEDCARCADLPTYGIEIVYVRVSG